MVGLASIVTLPEDQIWAIVDELVSHIALPELLRGALLSAAGRSSKWTAA